MPSVSEIFQQAFEHYQAGRWEEARQQYQQVLRQESGHADAWHHLGTLLFQMGQEQHGVQALQRALALAPGRALLHRDLGLAFQRTHQHDKALLCYQQALALEPVLAESHHDLGSAFYRFGRKQEALPCFRRALELRPSWFEGLNDLGVTLHDLGRIEEAAGCYYQACQLRPDSAEAFCNLGSAYAELKRPDEALDCFRAALRLKPDHAEARASWACIVMERAVKLINEDRADDALPLLQEAVELQPEWAMAHTNLALALQKLGRFQESLQYADEGVRLDPNLFEAHSILGRTFHALGRPEEALASCREALRLQPESAEGLTNLGCVLHSLGHSHEGLAALEQALRANPTPVVSERAHGNRALILLTLGRYQEGWEEYERRFQSAEMARTAPARLPRRWDGTRVQGQTLLLVAEQGLGDTIQFLRYAPLLRAEGMYVLALVPPELVPLARLSPGLDGVFAMDGPLPSYDFFCPLQSLPRHFSVEPVDYPAKVPYLFPDPRLEQHWRKQLSKIRAYKIGIAWQGNPTHSRDAYRSIPLRTFEVFARVPAVVLIGLQKGPGIEQYAEIQNRFPVLDLGAHLDKTAGAFMDTAAALKCLDLVVTIDSAIAHLAGALGLPVWVPLALVPDWRWGLEDEHTPWYPTMRLFRQTQVGQWDDVFQRMARVLLRLVQRGLG